MTNSRQPTNPFYVLCVLVGIAFTVTACANGVMMLRSNRGLDLSSTAFLSRTAPTEHPLMSFLDRYGMIILGGEVAVLAAVSLAAIMLDHYRGKRIKSARKQ
jgi:hypothetical protein